VLRIDKDPHARVALRAYSRSIQEAEPFFAGELMGWADRCEATQQSVQPDDYNAVPTIIKSFPMRDAYPVGHKNRRR